MRILFNLAAMLGICGATGSLLLSFLKSRNEFNKFSLPIGYAYTLLAFYFFYMRCGSASAACIFTMAIPLILAALVIGKKLFSKINKNESKESFELATVAKSKKDLWYALFIALAVLFIAGWPYFLTGFGNYWHSGNYDMQDGLNGRDAYVRNLIGKKTFDIGEVIGDKSWHNFALVTGTLSKAKQVDSYKEWYAGDGFRFQYSSLAFWSELLGSFHGLDIFILQALMNLVLMAIGIFFLCRITFGMGHNVSAIAALSSTVSSFYLMTYFAGHEGSMIYGALIPAFLSFAIPNSVHEKTISQRIIIGGLLATAILFTYPHPLIIIGFPILIYHLISNERIRRSVVDAQLAAKRHPLMTSVCGIFVLLLLTVATLLFWHLTEPYRSRASEAYRAWGYSLDWIILPLFLGLIKSPMQDTNFVGNVLSKPAYVLLVLFSISLITLIAICFFRAKTPRHHRFFSCFGVLWFIQYAFFVFFIKDCYYVYKFMYTHQFIFIIGFVAFVYYSKLMWIKAVGALLVLSNLSCDFAVGKNIFQSHWQNDSERFRKLLRINREILQNSFVTLSGADSIAILETLKANAIQPKLDPRSAEYFITRSGQDFDISGSQLSETIVEESGFAIKRVPAENYLMIRTWFEPEIFPSDPFLKNDIFRWVGDGKNDNVGIYIVRPKSPENMKNKYLRICFQKGPSADGDINMMVTAAGKEVLCQFKLGSGVHCEWIPASCAINAEQPLVIRSGAKGKSLLPHDDRRLIYRLFSVDWTDTLYDEAGLSYLNLSDDIVKKIISVAKREAKIRLGNGWEPLETFGGERFRWAGQPTELILDGKKEGGTAKVSIDLAPGPSLGTRALQIEVRDVNDKLVFTSKNIDHRKSITLPLHYYKNKTVYKLTTKSDSLRSPDSRILNYRVFNIELL